MEKVNELMEELIKVCTDEGIALSIATTSKNGETKSHMVGNFPGVIANGVAIRKAIDETFENLMNVDPIFSGLKKGYEAAVGDNKHEGIRPAEIHMAQIKSSDDLDFILSKFFGGK